MESPLEGKEDRKPRDSVDQRAVEEKLKAFSDLDKEDLIEQLGKYLGDTMALQSKVERLEQIIQGKEFCSECKKKAKPSTSSSRKIRYRRTFAELKRSHKCPVPDCDKVYASEGSLAQHITLKHITLKHSQYPRKLLKSDIDQFDSGDNRRLSQGSDDIPMSGTMGIGGYVGDNVHDYDRVAGHSSSFNGSMDVVMGGKPSMAFGFGQIDGHGRRQSAPCPQYYEPRPGDPNVFSRGDDPLLSQTRFQGHLQPHYGEREHVNLSTSAGSTAPNLNTVNIWNQNAMLKSSFENLALTKDTEQNPTKPQE
eukprot:Nk52_evm11s245 gene=Nk52_evmTU11s245